MANPFEVESCILHRQFDKYCTERSYLTHRTPNSPGSYPDQNIFSTLSQGQRNAFPTIAECAVHLGLLETFLVLKQKILKSNALDNTFGIHRAPRQSKTDPAWLEARKVKWDLFLDLAVVRYEMWWQKMAGRIAKGQFDEMNELPPLDVLMVWHTHMLMPGLYREELRLKAAVTRDETLDKCAGLSWKAIYAAIGSTNREYTMNVNQKLAWAGVTRMSHDLFGFLSGYKKMHAETLVVFACRTANINTLRQTPESHFPLEPGERELIELYIKPPEPSGQYLKEALQREQVFVEKMCKYLWIRSPYVDGTLTRALTRYQRFLELHRLRNKPRKPTPGNENPMLPPPVVSMPDIELAWQTHQLSPAGYYADCVEKVGKFVDNSHNLQESEFQRGWEWTKEIYRRKYGVLYSGCFCWICEGVKSYTEQEEVNVDWRKIGYVVKEQVASALKKERATRHQK